MEDLRIRKFNSGMGAILCNTCYRIVYSGGNEGQFHPIPKNEWESKEPCFCSLECEMKFKLNTNDTK